MLSHGYVFVGGEKEDGIFYGFNILWSKIKLVFTQFYQHFHLLNGGYFQGGVSPVGGEIIAHGLVSITCFADVFFYNRQSCLLVIQNEALADGNAAAELTFSVLSDLGMWN